jgi:hypothetical protein
MYNLILLFSLILTAVSQSINATTPSFSHPADHCEEYHWQFGGPFENFDCTCLHKEPKNSGIAEEILSPRTASFSHNKPLDTNNAYDSIIHSVVNEVALKKKGGKQRSTYLMHCPNLLKEYIVLANIPELQGIALSHQQAELDEELQESVESFMYILIENKFDFQDPSGSLDRLRSRINPNKKKKRSRKKRKK